MSVLSAETAAPALSLPGTPLPRVNLLPPELARRAQARRVKLGLGAGLLTVVGAVAVLHSAAVADVGDAATELQAATEAGVALQAEVQGYADVAAVHDRAAQAEAMLTEAMGQEVRYSGVLADLSRTMPADVWLESATIGQTAAPAGAGAAGTPAIGSVSFTGTALAHDDVATWLEVLAQQRGFADATFSGATTTRLGDRDTVTFSSTANLTAAALSERYASQDGG